MLDLTKEELDNYINGVDFHLNKLWELLPFLIDLKQSLIETKKLQESSIVLEVQELRKEIKTISQFLKSTNPNDVKLPSSYDQEMEELKQLLNTEWIEAVDPSFLSEKEENIEKTTIELIITESLKNKKFLDFCCNKGHSIPYAKINGASLAIGYDTKNNFIYNENDFYTDFDKVVEKGPFDVIFINNVLDYNDSQENIEILKKIKPILSHNGNVYIKMHPWSSRHGGEIANQLNKAFAHLLFDEIELMRFGVIPIKKNKILDPLKTYREWFKQSRLNIQEEVVIKSGVEAFFLSIPSIKRRFEALYKDYSEHYSKYINIDYVIYQLTKNKEISTDSLF